MLLQIDPHLLMRAHEAAQVLGQELHDGRHAGMHAHRAAHALGVFAKVAVQFFHSVQHAARVLKQAVTGGCQANAAPLALEQGGADGGFQLGHALADGGVRWQRVAHVRGFDIGQAHYGLGRWRWGRGRGRWWRRRCGRRRWRLGRRYRWCRWLCLGRASRRVGGWRRAFDRLGLGRGLRRGRRFGLGGRRGRRWGHRGGWWRWRHHGLWLWRNQLHHHRLWLGLLDGGCFEQARMQGPQARHVCRQHRPCDHEIAPPVFAGVVEV